MSALKQLLVSCLVCGHATLTWAQTAPAPAPASTGAGQAATVPIVSESDKKAPGIDNSRSMTSGRNRNDPGFKAPLNLRIRDEGVAMPKCARESREGEACK